MYESYAEVFAASPGHREYNERLTVFLVDLLERMAIQAHDVLDVACGVGDLALGLAGHDFAMTGVDLAPAMIDIARRRAATAGVPVTFEVADMRRLPHAAAFDLALCFGDSLNYMLTAADFRKALTSMRRALRPGGWAIFDLLTATAVATYYADQAYILQNSDEVYEAHENDFDAGREIGTLTVTAFVRRADGGYERIREVHHQRGYVPERVQTWAEAAGFTDLTWFTDWQIAETMEDDDGEPTRVFCMARAGGVS